MTSSQAQQFATLQKGTATYKNDTKMADHMRRREADLMSQAIEKNRRDEEDLRVVHGEVGEESRKQKNLDMERKRLREVMECDKMAIQKITEDLKIIETNEKEQKVNFVKEMESLNNENDFILTNCENKKLSHLLDVDNVQWLLEIELPAMLSNMHDGHANNSEENDGIVRRIKDEAALLIEIEGKSEALVEQTTELEILLQQLRNKFTNKHTNLGQMDVQNLEAKWMQQHPTSKAWGDDCDDAYEEEDMSEECTNNDDPKSNVNNTGGPSPIHMELFYND